MEQLSYLEMVEERGRTLVANGVVRVDEVDTLGKQRALRGRGVRLYVSDRSGRDADASRQISMGALRRLLDALPQALDGFLGRRDFWAHHSSHMSAIEILEAHELGQASLHGFASLDVAKRRFQLLEPTGTLDAFVDSWARVHGPDHVLVELESTREALEALVREITTNIAKPIVVIDAPATAGELPPDTPEAVARRAALVRDWLPADRVSRLMGSTAGNASQLPNRFRREGRLLGVWVVGEGRYRFPPWQFTDDGVPIPELKPLLEILRGPQGVAPGRETSGWEELEWLLAPNPYLDERSPSECFEKEPARVLEVARRQFGESPDARW